MERNHKRMGRNEITAMIAMVLLTFVTIFGVCLTTHAQEVNEYSLIAINASEEDWDALEAVLMNEVVGAFKMGEEGQWENCLATVETVFNRVLIGGWYGDTIKKVCTKRNQFVCKPKKMTEEESQLVSDAIEYVLENGRTITNSTNSTFFATFKQKYGKNHIWVGQTKNGKPVRGKGMWYSEQ